MERGGVYRCGADKRVMDERRVVGLLTGRAATRKHRKAFIMDLISRIAPCCSVARRNLLQSGGVQVVVVRQFHSACVAEANEFDMAHAQKVRATIKSIVTSFIINVQTSPPRNPLPYHHTQDTHVKMSLEAPPPSCHISSTPISLSSASSILETYLRNSEAHPHLHPDALITPTGVTFSSHGGPMGGVVMHNLRRVAAGLHGEYLEPEKTPEPEEDEGDESEKSTWKGNKKGGKGKKNVEEWQDIAEYEQEAGGIEVGELGPRTVTVAEGGEEPEVQATSGTKRKGEGEAADGKLSKDARKKAKKERDQQRKRDNEKKNASQAE